MTTDTPRILDSESDNHWRSTRRRPLDAAVISTGPQAYRRPDSIAVIPAALLTTFFGRRLSEAHSAQRFAPAALNGPERQRARGSSRPRINPADPE